jgi:hypothetical protein
MAVRRGLRDFQVVGLIRKLGSSTIVESGGEFSGLPASLIPGERAGELGRGTAAPDLGGDFMSIDKAYICPHCGSDIVRRSHRRGLVDRILQIVRIRPYRCQECYNRFFKLAA